MSRKQSRIINYGVVDLSILYRYPNYTVMQAEWTYDMSLNNKQGYIIISSTYPRVKVVQAAVGRGWGICLLCIAESHCHAMIGTVWHVT
jgi:hypothetical protein